MNDAQIKAKQVINETVVEAWRTWLLSARDMQEILISIAGDIAVNEPPNTSVQADGATATPSVECTFTDDLIYSQSVTGATPRRR